MRPSIIFPLLLGTGFYSTSALAQDTGGVKFSAVLLTIAIVLGLCSCIYVFVLSRRMQGSGIGAALTLYGFGMLWVVISLLSVTWLKANLGSVSGWSHDGFFILGFLIMVFGSKKVEKMFSSTR